MTNSTISIAGRKVGANEPPFIIAEMSGNHNQSLEHALRLVDLAASCGVDALKIQTYKPETMTLNISSGDFLIGDKDSLWCGRNLFNLYEDAHTPWEWHAPLFDRAKKHGLIIFSTPFDFTAVDFLEELDVPCYKIASFENTDIPLIKKVAATGRPLIISTGLASISELEEAVNAARDAGCKDLILLKCTSTYPASPEYTNILTIPHMSDLFGCQVGLSDHTQGIGVAVASVAMGATVIEKHFTSSRKDGGIDSAFSMEPDEMTNLVLESRRAWQSIGAISYGASKVEMKSLQFRRSLYVVSDVSAGDLVDESNVKSIRPGFGLPIKYKELVMGRTFKSNVSKGSALSWELLV